MSDTETASRAAVAPADTGRDQRPLAGILFLCLGTTLFPLQDVIIKSISGDYAVHEIVFFRGIFALPVVLLILHLDSGLGSLKLGSVPLQLFRAGSGFASYLVYYMALAALGMAETASITFSTPLFVTMMAVPFLGERIGWQRWTAVCVGLVGVVVTMRPGMGVFEPAGLLALMAAVTYAAAIIATRRLGNTTNGGTVTLFSTVFFILGGAVLGIAFAGHETSSAHPSVSFLFHPWVWPQGRDWLLLMALGGISGLGFYALTQAYRLADASVVTPFEYTYLPWAVLWGWVFFGALPGAHTWIGLVLIIGAGLFVIYREAALGSRVVRRRGLGVMRQR